MLQVEITLPLFETINDFTSIQYGEIDCAVIVEPDGDEYVITDALAYDLHGHRYVTLKADSPFGKLIIEHARLRCTERIEEEINNFDDWPRGRSDRQEHGLSRAQMGL